jgi:hypothetical protein
MTGAAPRARDARGRFVRTHSPQKRAAVRSDYENTSIHVEQLSIDHDVPAQTIYSWISAENWVRRRPRVIDTSDLLGRMLGLLERQTNELESAVNKGTSEVAVLAKLVTTLDKVLLLKERTARMQVLPSRRVLTLRGKIADRLIELNRD